MSIWVLMICIGLLFVTLSFSLRFLLALNLPFLALGHWQQASRTKRMQAQIRQGLLALADGQNARAQTKLSAIAETTDQPFVVIPALAQALGRQGKLNEAKRLLDQFVKQFPNAKQLSLLKLAEIYAYQGHHKSALDSLQTLHQFNPKHAEANQLMMDLLTRLSMWNQLIELLAEVGRFKQFDDEQLAKQQQLAYRQAFNSANTKQGSAAASCLDELQVLWNKAPKAITADAPSIVDYAKAMARIEGDTGTRTQIFIERSLAKQWSDDLVLVYGHLPLNDIAKSLKQAEQWQEHAKNSAALQLTLGRLCVGLELWGKAEDYLNASIQLQASKEAHAEMARLQYKMGQIEQAIANYRLASVF
jgi:HemY protein